MDELDDSMKVEEESLDDNVDEVSLFKQVGSEVSILYTGIGKKRFLALAWEAMGQIPPFFQRYILKPKETYRDRAEIIYFHPQEPPRLHRYFHPRML